MSESSGALSEGKRNVYMYVYVPTEEVMVGARINGTKNKKEKKAKE